ncbi:hypothetical protein DENSPDRAFT_906474 [Dentipellis sp. KUC8613]|nr:hypothetical protein DENSPDRAFT_906474 [Dentipellis sp. KUC8613]
MRNHESACRRQQEARHGMQLGSVSMDVAQLGVVNMNDATDTFNSSIEPGSDTLLGMHGTSSQPDELSHVRESDALAPPGSDVGQNSFYIEIVPHPASGKKSTIIPLDSSGAEKTHEHEVIKAALSCPWRPFNNLADFEYAEIAINSHKANATIDKELEKLHSSWASHTVITFRNHKDLEASLAAARFFVVGFQRGQVTSSFNGQDYTFSFYYRDPWEEILGRVRDASLCAVSMWYPVQKYIHIGTGRSRLYDETCTGDGWWKIQDTLPQVDGLPHCFLPLHVWSDGGRASTTVTKHPLIMRPLWLPSEIRNGSGNGGGVLLTYMPSIPDPAKPSERTPLERIAFGNFKTDVYHKVVDKVFEPIREHSHVGDTVTCGDDIARVLYPGIHIISIDHEEACKACGTRASPATYPCPRCLIRNDEQHNLSIERELRTTESMQAIYLEAKAASSRTAREAILQKYGLHFVENAFWSIANSDPYAALSYDTLHSDDIGKWGKHLWPLLLQVLSNMKESEMLATNMNLVPTWPGLSHFSCVTDIEYTDGNKHFDILRCILPCIVGILPRASPLIHCIRAYSRFRMYASLKCMSEGRLILLKRSMVLYGSLCQKVGNEYGKDWDFPKQHAATHLPSDIRNKGATINYSTRPGEGFQREMKEAYRTTNFKDTERQMSQVDANMEAIAHIRLQVDDADRLRREQEDKARKAAEHQNFEHTRAPTTMAHLHKAQSDKQWIFRAAQPRTYPSSLRAVQDSFHRFHHFASSLRQFLLTLAEGRELLTIYPFQCIELKFQSREDWKEGRDLLRCNPSFNGQPRFDCVMINTEHAASYGRLQFIFICRLPSGTELDICLIRDLEPSTWKPRTKWDGCRVFREGKLMFVLAKYLIRGCHMIPAFDSPSTTKYFYLNDLIDGDMFLRCEKM